ncbi:hypothetical protein P7C70_g3127, partial [Phenoliferia sp. Uapishka_3]
MSNLEGESSAEETQDYTQWLPSRSVPPPAPSLRTNGREAFIRSEEATRRLLAQERMSSTQLFGARMGRLRERETALPTPRSDSPRSDDLDPTFNSLKLNLTCVLWGAGGDRGNGLASDPASEVSESEVRLLDVVKDEEGAFGGGGVVKGVPQSTADPTDLGDEEDSLPDGVWRGTPRVIADPFGLTPDECAAAEEESQERRINDEGNLKPGQLNTMGITTRTASHGASRRGLSTHSEALPAVGHRNGRRPPLVTIAQLRPAAFLRRKASLQRCLEKLKSKVNDDDLWREVMKENQI